jgi:hypothetical protein
MKLIPIILALASPAGAQCLPVTEALAALQANHGETVRAVLSCRMVA